LRGSLERKLNLQALRMCEYVVTNVTSKPFLSEFYYRYAETLEELGQYDRAIAVYDTILATFPARQDKAEAAYRIGKIQMDRFNNPRLALKFFDSVTTHYVAGFGYNNALMSIPQAYLQLGDLAKAREEYARISAQRRSAESVEQADYSLALIDFFQHNYDSTKAALKRLTVNFPKGFLVNDAIQLSITIEQAEGANDLLDFFAGALQFQQMKLYDSTVSRLLTIADAENKALADIALFRLTETVLKRGDSAGAVKFIDRLESEHPESYYLPYGLKTKADVLFTKEDSLPRAKEIYKRLLENFQNYPFINEVRERMRKLESPAKPS
jgi:outer membrane protein assembly factor BamD (BamD/ComL family)